MAERQGDRLPASAGETELLEFEQPPEFESRAALVDNGRDQTVRFEMAGARSPSRNPAGFAQNSAWAREEEMLEPQKSKGEQQAYS
jgi:hypothetical protein